MILLLGAQGNLGSSLYSHLNGTEDIHLLDRETVNELTRDNLEKSQISIFENMRSKVDFVIVAAGAIDNNFSKSYLERLNFNLPRNLLELGLRFGFKTVTFGSIHEYTNINSNYMQSKRKFRDLLLSNQDFNFLHFQLNTLFSRGRVSSSSFLGQLKYSITEKVPFRMSSGHQLRQFHETDQVTRVVLHAIMNSKHVSSFVPVNSGQVFSLKDVATYILNRVHLPQLLQLDVLDDPDHEVYSRDFFDSFPINLEREFDPLENLFQKVYS